MTAHPDWLKAYHPDWSWAQVNHWLDVFYPMFGWICGAHVIVAYSWGIHRDDDGKILWAHRKEQAYAWPQQRKRLFADVMSALPYADISACPYLMRDKRRHKGNSLQRFSVHADIDGGFDAEMKRAVHRMPGGGAVASGTPGHAHIHVVMRCREDELDLPNHEHLCRVVGEYFGAVDPKISDNDTMRMSGTFNFKPLADDPGAAPLPVIWEVPPPGHYYCPTPTRLRQYLGTRKVYPGSASSGGAHGNGPGSQAQTEPVQLTWLLGVKAALKKDTCDRSDDTMRIVAACIHAGLTLPQTRWVINRRADLRERIHSRNDDDVGRCFAKITADRGEKAQG